MFNLFRPSKSQAQENMSDDEAQTIVYAFIDYTAHDSPFIGDSSTLPYPKETIRRAFYKHIEHYEVMRRFSAATFREMGYDKTVDELGAMLTHLDDWHDIDQEDKDTITKLNREQSLPSWAIPIMAKYWNRRSE